MKIDQRIYRLTGMTPLLGSQAANPAVRTEYLASKAPSPAQIEEEERLIPADTANERGLTVFMRREGDGALCVMDYTLVGFFKGACKALSAENGIKQSDSKIGTYLFVEPRVIPIMRDCQPVYETAGVLERPLRAQTMQGPRVTLTASEQVDAPWEMEIVVKLIANEGTGKSKPVTWDAVEGALDYGALKGLGQWRNGGWGRFTWERMK